MQGPTAGHPAVGLAVGQWHLPVVEGVVGCERLSAPPCAGHVLLVEEDTLHPCKGQALLGTVVVGGRARGALGRHGTGQEALHIPSAFLHVSQASLALPSPQRWAPTIPITQDVLAMPCILLQRSTGQTALPAASLLLAPLLGYGVSPQRLHPLPSSAVHSPWHCGTGQKSLPANPF